MKSVFLATEQYRENIMETNRKFKTYNGNTTSC